MLSRLLLFTWMMVGLAGAAGAAGAANAQTVELGLAQASNCMSCHRVDKKVVGPGFKAIAQRFAGNPEAVDYLANSIINGSRGRWGPVPMPRQAHVSKRDAQTLAQWILSLNAAEGSVEQ